VRTWSSRPDVAQRTRGAGRDWQSNTGGFLLERKTISQAESGGDFWVAGEACDLVSVHRSETLLVTFDNLATINQRPDERPWPAWLASRAEALNYSVLGVQSHQKDWYRNAETPAMISELQASGYFDRFENIVFTGTSMGGFAALCFAGLVPGARVLAFSPQSTLNRRIAPFERRYPYPFRKFDWESPDYLDAAKHVDAISGGHVFYDPKVPEDHQHAKRLLRGNLKGIRVPHAGHTLIRIVVKAGALEHLLETYPSTGKINRTFFELLRNRRDNPVWAKQIIKSTYARGNSDRAHRVGAYLSREHGHRFAKRMLRRLAERQSQQ